MAMLNIGWTEMLCILHVAMSKDENYNFMELLLANKILEDNDISLETLLHMKQKKFDRLIPDKLREKLSKIRYDFAQKKAIWLTETPTPYYRSDRVSQYNHWLPLDPSRLLRNVSSEVDVENNWDKILREQYEEFDTLVHVTHIDTTAKIFEDELRTNKVSDNSVFSKIPGHPNEATEVIWFGPAMKEKLEADLGESRYGNVAFYMNILCGSQGIRRYPGDWKYYFVEVIDYARQSACRILVTPNTYHHLRPYDPTQKGGPWYYDKENGKDYWLKDINRWDGSRGHNGNSLEIMRENYGSWQHQFLKNLHICPVTHPGCLRGNCNFRGDYKYEFDVLTSIYKPIPYKRKEASPDHMQIDSVKPTCEPALSSELSSQVHALYIAFLLDTEMIENAKSKITFWKNLKSNVEKITSKDFSLGELTLACEQNEEVKKSLFVLMLAIAAENFVKRSLMEVPMDEFPYSFQDVLQYTFGP